jgi:hypothetical protein
LGNTLNMLNPVPLVQLEHGVGVVFGVTLSGGVRIILSTGFTYMGVTQKRNAFICVKGMKRSINNDYNKHGDEPQIDERTDENAGWSRATCLCCC